MWRLWGILILLASCSATTIETTDRLSPILPSTPLFQPLLLIQEARNSSVYINGRGGAIIWNHNGYAITAEHVFSVAPGNVYANFNGEGWHLINFIQSNASKDVAVFKTEEEQWPKYKKPFIEGFAQKGKLLTFPT